MEEAKRYWAVRQVVSEVLEKQLVPAAKGMLLEEPTCLWGEVIEVREYPTPRVHVRDKETAEQRIWVILPANASMPGEGDMICVEGTLKSTLDEGSCSVSLHFEGQSIIENKGLSARIRAQRKALDEIEARKPVPRQLTGPINRVVVVSSEWSKGRNDFKEILHQKVKYGLGCTLMHVRLQDASSIAAGIRDAGRSGADMVIVTRGGGPKWQLSLFAEPVVAEALAALSQPALVAVGHVGDEVEAHRFAAYRANTPSEAAAIVARLYYDNREPRASEQPWSPPSSPGLATVSTTASLTLAPTPRPEGRSRDVFAIPKRPRFWARLFASLRSALRTAAGFAVMAGIFVAGWKGAPLWDKLLMANRMGMSTGPAAMAPAGQTGTQQPIASAQKRPGKEQNSASKRPLSGAQGASGTPTNPIPTSGTVRQAASP